MRLILFAATALSIFVTASAQAAEDDAPGRPVQLRWKFNPGERMNVQMTQDMTTDMDVAGQTISTKVLNRTWMQWQTEQVNPDGGATIHSEITRVVMEVTNPLTGSYLVDTDDEPAVEGQAAQIDNIMRPMVGVTMVNVMSPTGKVSDVKIPEEALAGIKGAMGNAVMSAEQMGQMVQNVSPVFPDQGLVPGDSWNHSAEIPTPVGVMKTQTQYTYQGVLSLEGREMQRIDIDTTMAFKAPEGGPEIEIADQNCNGTLLFDNQKGRLQRSDIEQAFTVKVRVAPGQVMEQKNTQKVSNVFQ